MNTTLKRVFLNSLLEMYYAANPGLSQLHLTLAMIKPSDGGHPTLKSKAAACRHAAYFALWIAQRHVRLGFELEDSGLKLQSFQIFNVARPQELLLETLPKQGSVVDAKA